METSEGSSFVNRQEAEVIAKLVGNIMCHPITRDRNIGIVTFYDRQRILIRHILRDKYA